MFGFLSQSWSNAVLYKWGYFPYQTRVVVRDMEYFRVTVIVRVEDILYLLQNVIERHGNDILSVGLLCILG